MIFRSISFLLPVSLLFFSCSYSGEETSSPARIREIYQTAWNDSLDIDSPTVWNGANGENLLIATAKQGDMLMVYDAATGETLRTVGSTGTGPNELDRPNGIAVVDSLLFIVERDNARIQVFDLPSFRHRGFIGVGDLVLPYGIFAYTTNGACLLFITDNYETPDELIPPDSELGKRVWRYTVSVTGDTLAITEAKPFGATEGTGVLHVVESIAGDPAANRLLIADEQEHLYKEYTLDGNFTGRLIGKNVFQNDPEGIVRWHDTGDSGWWIMTDQWADRTVFHMYDGATLDYLGAFTGETTANTDGIALTTVAFGPFPQGTLFAVHNDGGVSAFSLRDVIKQFQK